MADFLALRRLLRRYQPHVIHTHRQKENVLAGLANATTLRAPCVRTVHGAPEHAPPWSQLHKRLFAGWTWRLGAIYKIG
ncbi:MAG: glycosyltransferase [Candidatus Competibacteraceae bacterium]